MCVFPPTADPLRWRARQEPDPVKRRRLVRVLQIVARRDWRRRYGYSPVEARYHPEGPAVTGDDWHIDHAASATTRPLSVALTDAPSIATLLTSLRDCA